VFTPFSFLPFRLRGSARLALAALSLVLLAGCGRIHHENVEKVYVSTQQTYLRDRVAAVYTRTGEVTNGEPLVVLEHARRFLRVRTPKNETGWVEEHMVIDQKVYDGFQQLAADHKDDQPFATATLSDDLYMHLTPGRDTDRFYRIAGNTKVQLLERGSVPKVASNVPPAVLAKLAETAHTTKNESDKDNALPAPPAMEDWWLVRDPQGRTGWMLARDVSVDVPEDIEQYGEGQDFVGAWKIATVNDPESNAPNHDVPEYLTLMAPPKSGQPFDFDQVRVFTWSRIHHRYETGFRLHPIQGFLPVKIFTAPAPQGPRSGSGPQGQVPAFSFTLAATDQVITDPTTGVMRPAAPRTIQYEMIDTQVKRIGADTAPIPTKHDEAKEKAQAKKKVRPRRRN
jgi:hypothetical protein